MHSVFLPQKISLLRTAWKWHLCQQKGEWPQCFTSLGHPKMENGKMPDENQVSRTSSSKTREQKLQNKNWLHWMNVCSCKTLTYETDLYSSCSYEKLKRIKFYPVWGWFCQWTRWSVLLPSLWLPPLCAHSPSNDHPCPGRKKKQMNKESEM